VGRDKPRGHFAASRLFASGFNCQTNICGGALRAAGARKGGNRMLRRGLTIPLDAHSCLPGENSDLGPLCGREMIQRAGSTSPASVDDDGDFTLVAKGATERRAIGLSNAARKCLDKNDLEKCYLYVKEALALNPNCVPAQELLELVERNPRHDFVTRSLPSSFQFGKAKSPSQQSPCNQPPPCEQLSPGTRRELFRTNMEDSPEPKRNGTSLVRASGRRNPYRRSLESTRSVGEWGKSNSFSEGLGPGHREPFGLALSRTKSSSGVADGPNVFSPDPSFSTTKRMRTSLDSVGALYFKRMSLDEGGAESNNFTGSVSSMMDDPDQDKTSGFSPPYGRSEKEPLREPTLSQSPTLIRKRGMSQRTPPEVALPFETAAAEMQNFEEEESRFLSPQTFSKADLLLPESGSSAMSGIEGPMRTTSPIINQQKVVRNLAAEAEIHGDGVEEEKGESTSEPMEFPDSAIKTKSKKRSFMRKGKSKHKSKTIPKMRHGKENGGNQCKPALSSFPHVWIKSNMAKTPGRLQCEPRLPEMVHQTPTREQLAAGATDSIEVAEQIAACKNAGIKLVALDFDNTLINIHTKGKWKSTAEELVMQVRPVFMKLIPEIWRANMLLSIVSFSPQVQIIKQLLSKLYGSKLKLGVNTFVCGALPLTTSRTPGRAHVNSIGIASPKGKTEHLRKVCEEYCDAHRGATHLKPHEILLIDDDLRNIDEARKNRNRAILFRNSEPDDHAAEKKFLADLSMRKWC